MSAPAFASVKDPAPPVRRYQLLTSSDLADRPRLRWRVKNVLPQTGFAALIGPSGSGKTFLALDLAAAVARGDPWFGNRVHEAPVAYVALEGEAGIANRIAAYEIRTRRTLYHLKLNWGGNGVTSRCRGFCERIRVVHMQGTAKGTRCTV